MLLKIKLEMILVWIVFNSLTGRIVEPWVLMLVLKKIDSNACDGYKIIKHEPAGHKKTRQRQGLGENKHIGG